MKKTYSVLSWNINRRGGTLPIHDIVSNNLLTLSNDINILTEFTSNNSEKFNLVLKENSYTPFSSNKKFKKGYNDVLILIKNSIVKEFDSVKTHWFDENLDYPNFLQVTLKKASNIINIIGVRVRIKNYTVDDCKYRKKQIDNLIKYLNSIKGTVILAGDFNNLKHNDTDTIEIFQNSGLPSKHYNYPMIKEEFEKHGLDLITPSDGISWYGGENNECKLDHLVGRNILIKNISYTWHFLKEVNVHKIYELKNNKNGPDHAMLIANVEIKD